MPILGTNRLNKIDRLEERKQIAETKESSLIVYTTVSVEVLEVWDVSFTALPLSLPPPAHPGQRQSQANISNVRCINFFARNSF